MMSLMTVRSARNTLMAIFAIWSCSIQAQGQFEAPPVLDAGKILPGSVASGPNYRVEQRVVNDGLMNTYRITSTFGTFEAHSDAELAKRIQEIGAIAKLKELERSKEFAKGISSTAGNVVEGTKSLVTKPVDTVSGAVKGAGTMLRRTGDSLFGDPKSRYEDDALKSISGTAENKREFASRMNVDPYSSNEVLQDALTRVARAAAAGNIVTAGALAAVGGGVGTAISVTGGSQTLNEMLRRMPPTDIRRMNREKLQKIGISADLIDLFNGNSNFSPTYQMLFVDALERLGGVSGREALIKGAISADSDALAMLRQRQARMLAGFHEKVQPLQSLSAAGNVVAARTRDGKVVIAVPVDYIVWTDSVANGASTATTQLQATAATAPRELWVGGGLSPGARKELEARGWKVFDKTADKLIGPG
jgi:hypothetical protein